MRCRCGKLLVDKYKTFVNAGTIISELILCIEGVWIRLEIQIETLRNIWDSLNGRLQVYQNTVLQHLYIKIQIAIAELDGIIGKNHDTATSPLDLGGKKGALKRGKFVALEASLQRSITELELWHRRFDPSWFLITRIQDLNIDRKLADCKTDISNDVSSLIQIRNVLQTNAGNLKDSRSVFLERQPWLASKKLIPYSSAHTAWDSADNADFIIDTTDYPRATNIPVATAHVRDIARILSTAKPSTFGLLNCRGATKVLDQQNKVFQFELIYHVPHGLVNPTSLRQSLVIEKKVSLDERFHIAKALTKSVMFMHTSAFVHKNIRPETIITFEDHDSRLRTPFLVGFERFRPAAAGSNLSSDAYWWRNLYRHPKRQGILPEELYCMQHDIYSLGVCLLEIGIWTSFIHPDAELQSPPLLGNIIAIESQLSMKDQALAAFEIKRALVSLAQLKLPSEMGLNYTEIVISCLTCLDRGESNLFGNEADLQDDDGIVVAVQYIEKVLLRLEIINI